MPYKNQIRGNQEDRKVHLKKKQKPTLETKELGFVAFLGGLQN